MGAAARERRTRRCEFPGRGRLRGGRGAPRRSKIGMVTQLTGPNAFGGHEYQYGAEMALEHIGGEINGRKIEMVFADGPTQDAPSPNLNAFTTTACASSSAATAASRTAPSPRWRTTCRRSTWSLAWDADLLQGPSTYFFRGGRERRRFLQGRDDAGHRHRQDLPREGR